MVGSVLIATRPDNNHINFAIVTFTMTSKREQEQGAQRCGMNQGGTVDNHMSGGHVYQLRVQRARVSKQQYNFGDNNNLYSVQKWVMPARKGTYVTPPCGSLAVPT